LVVIGVVVAGFGPGYARSVAAPGLPWWVHLHGAVMTAWIALFVAQGRLARHRSMAWHQRLGALSVALVVAMIVLAAATSAMSLVRGEVPPFFTPAKMLCAGILNMAGFLVFYVAAVAMRSRTDWHKRLMLVATILLTWPALVRLVALQHVATHAIIPVSIATLLALMLVAPALEFAWRRRLHPAYLWGLGVVALLLPLYTGLGNSAALRLMATHLAY
jgi:hypothetical protein